MTSATPAPSRSERLRAWVRSTSSRVWHYFADQDPTFWVVLTPALLLAAALFVRSPWSNYIFDEQEALLANPYVNGKGLGFWDAFRRDFWGLPATRSIGSYRPLPDLIWRLLWHVSEQPWLHHWVNVIFHAINATLVAGFVWRVTGERRRSWLAGGLFLMCALLTEAITGVVGIADVLGGFGVLLAVVALRWPWWGMPFGVFGALAIGFFSKESCLVAVPLVPWVALVTAPALHPGRPLRAARALLALTAATCALVFYTYFRRHFFPVSLPPELTAPLPSTEPLLRRAMHEFLRWFQQPRLPNDPINNPLAEADTAHRVAGALRVYWRGLTQIVVPRHLSGDYSFPQEPIPTRIYGLETVLGGLCLLVPPVVALGAWIRALWLERKPTPKGGLLLLAIGLMWVPVAYFPHSNIPVLLPTVRAERFWYLPVMGAALILSVPASWWPARLRWRRAWAGLLVAFFAVQAVQARRHAIDYTSDLMFWRATREAVPNSAKAHLNYSVMVGARGELGERLAVNAQAMALAPDWPMARVYYADTLCRMDRVEEAFPHYVRGFEMDPNSSSLIALGLQCLWDKKAIDKHADELLALATRHPGSWLAYLAREIVYNGKANGGVEKQYRPRGYDQGPKDP